MKLSQSKKNKIAGLQKIMLVVTDDLTYYDIKYALSDTSEFELRKHFSHSRNVEKLFSDKDIRILLHFRKDGFSNEDDLRRIALFMD